MDEVFEADDLSSGVSFSSGLAGPVEAGLRLVGEVAVPGGTARRFEGGDRFVLLWNRAPQSQPCFQYSVSAYGITRAEFDEIVRTMKHPER